MKFSNYLVSLLEGRYASGAKIRRRKIYTQLNLLNIPHSVNCSIERYLIQDRSALFLPSTVWVIAAQPSDFSSFVRFRCFFGFYEHVSLFTQ